MQQFTFVKESILQFFAQTTSQAVSGVGWSFSLFFLLSVFLSFFKKKSDWRILCWDWCSPLHWMGAKTMQLISEFFFSLLFFDSPVKSTELMMSCNCVNLCWKPKWCSSTLAVQIPSRKKEKYPCSAVRLLLRLKVKMSEAVEVEVRCEQEFFYLYFIHLVKK